MTEVFIRVDGSTEIGLGHIIRTCALAEMLRDGFCCTFFVRNPSGYIKQEILKTGSKVVALATADSYLEEAKEWTAILTGKEIVVLDGYPFITDYQQQIKKKGCKLVCIDDIHACHFVADIVINHAGGVKPEQYSVDPGSQLCLGFDFALLRSCFLQASKRKQHKEKEENRVFVSLGGADPHNHTLAVVLETAARYPELHFDVVIGGAYLHKEALSLALSGKRILYTIYESLNATAMLELMLKTPRAICSPSSVSIEYLTTGGELYLLQTADNQEGINRYYQAERLGFHVNDFIQPADAFNQQLLNNVFDGSQAQRISTLFKNLNEN